MSSKCGGCEEVLRAVWGSVGRGLEKCGGKCKEVCLDVGKCGGAVGKHWWLIWKCNI